MKARERILLGTAVAMACLSGCEAAVSGSPVSVAIIDDSAAPGRSYDSVQRVGNAPFRDFVAGILSHAAATSAGGEFEFVGREGAERAALVFVRLPIATSGDEALAPAPEFHASSEGCRVQSPWFELTVRNGAIPVIQGLFVWNERQILQDLAYLAGEAREPLAPPRPLAQGTWQELAELYAREVLIAPPQGRADEALENRIPDDILFLFKQAPQSTFVPFDEAARETMGDIARAAVERQVALATTLAQRCLDEGSLMEITDAAQAAQVVSKPK